MTGIDDKDKTKFNEEDVVQLKRWKAHADLIKSVTYVPELNLLASCSFDCNVYMWDK
jgi:WD40 repeat protein